MFLHLITLCIGLLIAAGLQQIYEFLQRRRRTRALVEAERKAAADPLPPQDPPPISQP
jgi:hypothetical protein